MKEKITVIGSGTMGSGIAQVFASFDYSVSLYDNSSHSLNNGLSNIKHSLKRLITKQRITEKDKEDILDRIQGTTDLSNAVKDTKMVIEAITENFNIKREVLRKIETMICENTIMASNTSSISITRLASSLQYPNRMVGMHFFNPVPLMSLVEVVKGVNTSENVHDRVMEYAHNIGKTPVSVNDSVGFVSNRVLMPMINEAIFCVFENVATVENVDAVMKLGMAHPMGPLKLADLIGLDVCLHILNTLYNDLCDPKYRPCPLLVRMVDAGHYGKKSGKGFYQY